MEAFWIIETSLPPSPTAKTVCFVVFFRQSVMSLYVGVSARRNLLFGSDAAADGALEARGIGEKGGLFGNGGDGGAGEDEKRARGFFVREGGEGGGSDGGNAVFAGDVCG